MEYPKPKNFKYDEVFYDNNEILIMCGRYKGSTNYSIGMRWTIGESDLGYPNIFGKKMWMVLPDKIGLITLNGLLSSEEERKHFRRIDLALKYRDEIQRQLINE